jgi:hypothetical protein
MVKLEYLICLINSSLVLTLFITHLTFAQKTIKVTKTTKTFSIENLEFKPIWDDSLSYSDNIDYYGGIKELKVYRDGKLLNTINNIEDNIALGYINFSFHDHNLDGYLDFTVPLNDKFPMYYLFNPKTQKYQRAEDWDYLRDYSVDKDNKIIRSNSYDYPEIEMYKIDGLKLIKLNP